MRLPTQHPYGYELRVGNRLKIKGLNLVPKSSDIAAPGANETGWESMWHAGYDWAGWIKPQVDICVNHGANTVKTTMPFGKWIDQDASAVATVTDRVRSFVDYVTDAGLMIYWNLSVANAFPTASLSQVEDAVAATASLASEAGRVIGLDIVNEVDIGGSLTTLTLDTFFATSVINAARAVTRLPLTLSMNMQSSAEWTDFWVDRLNTAGADFYDFHPYYSGGANPALSDLTAFRASASYKPWLIGEIGQQVSAGSSAQLARWESVGTLSAEPDSFGAVGFSIVDYDTNELWGMYPADFSAPRTQISEPFSQWPDRP